MNRNFSVIGFIFIFFLLYSLLSHPISLTRNYSALNLLSICNNTDSDYLLLSLNDVWFQAIAYYCMNDNINEKNAFESAFLSGIERISIVRSINPHDLVLARLAAEHFSRNPDAQFWLAENLAQNEDYQSAIRAFEQGLELFPFAALNWRKLGDLYQKQGDWERAVNAYEKACLLNDPGGHGCPLAGKIYLEQGLYYLAEKRYRDALVDHPDLMYQVRGLTIALLAQGKYEEAIPYLHKLAQNGDVEAMQQLQQIKEQKP